MNPRHLSATELLIWGIVLHLVADWLFQSRWMAENKAKLSHPAGYIHAGIHGLFLGPLFGWAVIPLAFTHLIIDTRKPLEWWAKIMPQTPVENRTIFQRWQYEVEEIPLYDLGMEIMFWRDQTLHILCIAVAAVLVT